ncbi:MAG: hypothetical protein HRU12_17690, partial [Phaeodactylibacter sp.]|nr:hypothetical protein [Phaeodactylibacter sp.]
DLTNSPFLSFTGRFNRTNSLPLPIRYNPLPFTSSPNPTTGQLHVQFPGQQVCRAQGPFYEQHTLDLSGLPPGFYTLWARTEMGIRVEKVAVR